MALIKKDNLYFSKSNDIEVFPCAFRGKDDEGKSFNIESKLNTEFNFSQIPHGLNNNYVISKTNNSIDIIIKGYYFRLTNLTETELNTYRYIGIKLREQEITNGDTTKYLNTWLVINNSIDQESQTDLQQEQISNTILDTKLDSDYIFTGLALSDSKTNLANAYSILDVANEYNRIPNLFTNENKNSICLDTGNKLVITDGVNLNFVSPTTENVYINKANNNIKNYYFYSNETGYANIVANNISASGTNGRIECKSLSLGESGKSIFIADLKLVTTNIDQTITGQKTFANTIKLTVSNPIDFTNFGDSQYTKASIICNKSDNTFKIVCPRKTNSASGEVVPLTITTSNDDQGTIISGHFYKGTPTANNELITKEELSTTIQEAITETLNTPV